MNGALVHGGSVVEADGTDAVSTEVDSLAAAEVDSLAVDAEVDVVAYEVDDGDG